MKKEVVVITKGFVKHIPDTAIKDFYKSDPAVTW